MSFFRIRSWRRWRIACRLLFLFPTNCIGTRGKPRCLQSPFQLRFTRPTSGEYGFLAVCFLIPLITLLIIQYTQTNVPHYIAFFIHIANTLTLAHYAILYVCILLLCSAAIYLFRHASTAEYSESFFLRLLGLILCAVCSTYFIFLGENSTLFATFSTGFHLALQYGLVITAVLIALLSIRVLVCQVAASFYLMHHLEEEMDLSQMLPLQFSAAPVSDTVDTDLLRHAVYAFWRQGYPYTYNVSLNPLSAPSETRPRTPQSPNLDYIALDTAQCDGLHHLLYGPQGLLDRCHTANIQLKLLSHSPLYASSDQFIQDINDNVWTQDGWKHILGCHIVPRPVVTSILRLCIQMEKETKCLSNLYTQLHPTLNLFWMTHPYGLNGHEMRYVGEISMLKGWAIVCIMAGLLTRCMIYEMVTGLISGTTVLYHLDQQTQAHTFLFNHIIARQYLGVRQGNPEQDGPDVRVVYCP